MNNLLSVFTIILLILRLALLPAGSETFEKLTEKGATKSEKILLIVTSADKLLLKDGSEMNTGYWAEELIEPMKIFESEGFNIDIGTLGGKKPPVDQSSINPDMLGGGDKQYGEAKAGEYREIIENSRKINNPIDLEKLDEKDLKDYAAIFIVGGHGVLADLANSKKIGSILSWAVHNPGQIISAVCHGPCAFRSLSLIGEEKYLKDIPMTGFSEEEEESAGLKGKVPFELETTLKDMGVSYSHAGPFAPYIVSDKSIHKAAPKFVTGQNPASSIMLANKLVEYLNSPALKGEF